MRGDVRNGVWLILPGVAVLILLAQHVGSNSPGGSRLRAQEDFPMVDKERLARRVESLGDDYARMIRAHGTEVEQLPTPFFADGAIYRVTYMTPSRPVAFTVGCAEPDLTLLLQGKPERYVRLATKARLHLDSDERRAAYLLTFLEATRSFAQRFQIVERADQIQPRPGLGKDDAEHFRRLQTKYESVIAPLRLSVEAPWRGTVFALRGQSLVRITLQLESDGRIRTEETILEADLPIPYSS
jgi:hypothetical protein